MRILAMDTSTLTGSVALVDAGVVVAEVAARMRAAHSEELLPVVDEVLRRGDATLASVDLIAVGIGPGSFTGVRIGLATAKGLQLATGKPLMGIGSLEALASSAVGARGIVATVLDARRDEVFYAVWEVGMRARRTVVAAACAAPEQAGLRVRDVAGDTEVLAIGDLDAVLWTRFLSSAGAVDVLASEAGAPLARFVAHEAARRAAAGEEGARADEIEPMYVRGSDAKVPAGLAGASGVR